MNRVDSVLITGASGFIGGRLLDALSNVRDLRLIGVSRKEITHSANFFRIETMDGATDWSAALVGIDVVIHAAARAHVMKDSADSPLAEYRKVNVDGTLRLASQAAKAGVKRFIFISSIKVNGESTPVGRPFTPEDDPAPQNSYGISKLEAERGLMQLASETCMQVVIIRPPMVYGAGVKGNFSRLAQLVRRGIPLPLGSIHNRRSLIGIDNLLDLIMCCIDHPAAANQVFLAADGEDLSTTELLRGLGLAMGKPARLIALPAGLLRFGATLLGKKAVAQRLLGSLQVDIGKANELLDWRPPRTVKEGLRRCFEPSH